MNLKLKMAILESGMTQRHLAEKTGIHESIISMTVTGKYNPDQKQKRKISKALGKPESELFEAN